MKNEIIDAAIPAVAVPIERLRDLIDIAIMIMIVGNVKNTGIGKVIVIAVVAVVVNVTGGTVVSVEITTAVVVTTIMNGKGDMRTIKGQIDAEVE
ncbi:15301_t:CDS:1, partial [Acaulospora colombiana]